MQSELKVAKGTDSQEACQSLRIKKTYSACQDGTNIKIWIPNARARLAITGDARVSHDVRASLHSI